jgi:hypothetical protein
MVKCPKGTRKNKKTGLCEPIISSKKFDNFVENVKENVERKLENDSIIHPVSKSKSISKSISKSKSSSEDIIEIDSSRKMTIEELDDSINKIRNGIEAAIKIIPPDKLTNEKELIDDLNNITKANPTSNELIKDKFNATIKMLKKFFKKFKKSMIWNGIFSPIIFIGSSYLKLDTLATMQFEPFIYKACLYLINSVTAFNVFPHEQYFATSLLFTVSSSAIIIAVLKILQLIAFGIVLHYTKAIPGKNIMFFFQEKPKVWPSSSLFSSSTTRKNKIK